MPERAARTTRRRWAGSAWQAKWHALPLRTRLAALTTALLVAGLGITGVASLTILHRYLLSEVDAELEANAADMARITFTGRTPETDAALPSDYYVRLTPLLGDVREWVLPDTQDTYGAPVLDPLTVEATVSSGSDLFTAPGTDATSYWRVASLPVVTGDNLVLGRVEVALPLRGVSQTVAQLGRILLLSGAAIALLGAIAGSMAVRRALRPLRDVEATAHAFAEGDLTQRIPGEPPTTEVGRLALSLNGMLARIEEAFAARAASEAKMRRFVADASHELRTPLATVRGYGELYRMGGIRPDDVPQAMKRIEDEAVRMGALVTDLLQLAKLDDGRPLAHEPVDLRVLAADAATDLRALDPTRTVRVVNLTPTDDAPLLVQGDEHRLRQVLANLTGNVVQHTPAGSPVEIAVGCGETAGAVVVEVRDHGPGIPPEDAERVFERFYRLDSSRTRASGGSGLGLAIVAAIVAAHDGEVTARPTPDGGTTVRVILPGSTVPRGLCHDGMPEEADQG